VDTKEWEEVWQGEATFIKPQKRERGLGVARGLARGWWEKSMMALVHSWTESAEEEECIHFLSTLYHRTTLVQTDTGRRGWRCLDEVVPCLRPCLDPSDMHVHRGATATAKSKVKNGLTTSLTPSMREIITQFHGGKPEDKAKQGQPEGRVARWGGLGKPRNHSESSNFSQEEKPYWWVGERDNKGPSSIKDNKQNTIYPFESFVVPSLQLHLAHLTEEQGKEKRSIEDDHTLSSLPDQPTRNPEDKLPASYHREALSSRTHLLMMTGKIISYLDFHQDPYIRYLFSSPGGERPPPDDIQLKEQAEVESRQRMLKLKAFGKKQPSRKPFGKMISKVITNNNRDPFSKTTPEQSLSHTDMKAMDNAALLATKARMSQTQPSLAKHSGVGDKYEEQEAGLTKTKTLGGADAEIDWEAMVQQPPPVEEGPDVDSDSEDASPRISMVVQDSPPKASEITPTPSAPLVMKEPEAVLRPSTRQIEDPGAKAEEAPKSNKETDKYVPMAPGFSTDDLLLRGGSDVFDGESFDMAKSRLSLKKVLPAPEDEMGTKPGVVASPKRVQPGYNNIKEPRDPPKNEQDPSPPVLRASGRISQPSPQAEFAGPALVVTKASVTHTPTLVAPTPLAPMPKSVKIEATESEEVQQTAEEAAEEARMSKIRLWGDAKKTTTTTEETVEETVEEEEGDDEKTDSDEGEDETSPKERPKRAFALQDVDDSEVPDDADRAESAKERHKRAKRERKNPRKKPVGTTINDQVETPEQESQLQEYVPSALALQTPPAGPSAPTEADTQSRQVVLESYLESVGVLGGEANADSSTAESTLVSGSSSELVATAASSTAPGAVDTAELPDAPSDSGAEAQAASGSLEAEDALGLNEEVIAAAPSSSNDLIAAAIVGAPAIPSASEILSVPSGLVDDDVVEAQVEADREVAEAQVDAVGSLRDIVVADAPPISEADLTPQSAPRGQRRRVLRKRNTKLDASVVDDPATIARQDGALVGGGDEPATARQNDALKGGGGDDSQVRVIQEDGREVRIIKVVGASGYEEEWEEYSEHGSDAGGDEADDEEEYDAAHEEAVTERSDSTSKVTQNHSEKGNVTQIYNEKGKVTKNYSEKSSRRPEKQKKAIHQDGVVMRTDGLAESHADNGGDLSVQVSATTTPEQLQATFSAFGAVVGIEVLKDTGGHSRTAIISFDSAGSAAKALSGLNGVMLDEKHLIISPAERVEDTNTDTGTPMHHFRAAPRLVLPIIHVKNVSEKTTEEQLRSVFAKFGKVTACALKVGSSHVFQGVAVVNFKTCESAAQALAEMNGALLDDNHLVVSPAQRVEHHDVESDQVFVHYTATYRSSQFADLFVKNLSEGTTQDSLQQEFAAFAISTSCEVFSDAKGKSWGMAIACFATPEDAQKALLGMNGRTVAGHKLAVTQTRRRRRAPQSGQGYSQRYKAYGGAGQLTKHTVEDKTLMGLLVNEGREGPEEWWESFSESDSTAEGTEVKSHTHADEYAGGETGSAEDGASARAGGRSTDENASVTSGDMPELRTKTTRPRHRGRRPLRASIVAVTGMGAAVAALRDYDRAKALEAGGEQSEIGETATDSPSRGTVLDDKKSRLHNLRKTSEFDDLARVRESQGTTSGQEESGPVDEEQRVGDIDEDRASEGEKSEEDSETGRQSRKLEEPQQPSPPLLDFAGLAGSETYRSENQTKRESEDPEDHARKGGGYRTGRAKHGIDSEEGRPQRKPSRRQSKVTNNEEERKANLSEPMPSGRLEGGASWSWAPDGLGEEPATFSGRALPGRTPLKNAKSANVSFPRSLNTLRRGDSSDSFDSSRRRSTIEPLVSDELDVWASSSIHDDLDLKAEARLARDVSIAELQLRVPLSGPKNGLRSANGQKTAQTPLHRLSVSAGGVPVYGSVALGQRAEKYLTAEGAMLSPRRLAENTGTDQGSFSARARLAPSNATLSGGVNGAQPWSHDASFVDSAGNSFLTETEEWDNRQWTRPKTAGSDPVSGPGAVTQFTTEDGVIPLMRHDFQIPERPTAFVSDRKDTHDLISVRFNLSHSQIAHSEHNT
jgi:RNA recognition motif-containing protein